MIVQSPLLGVLGRFANWLIQYMLSIQFANKHDAVLQTPNWIGEVLFDIKHDRIADPIPLTKFNPDGSFNQSEMIALDMFYKLPSALQPLTDKPTTVKTFRWKKQFDPKFVPVNYVVVHNRTGDFSESNNWPQLSLDDQLSECIKFGFRKDMIHVVSDSIRPQQSVYPESLNYLYDFQLMCVAKHLFVYPGSTFSLMASKFNMNHVYVPSNYVNGPTKATYSKELCQDQ